MSSIHLEQLSSCFYVVSMDDIFNKELTAVPCLKFIPVSVVTISLKMYMIFERFNFIQNTIESHILLKRGKKKERKKRIVTERKNSMLDNFR